LTRLGHGVSAPLCHSNEIATAFSNSLVSPAAKDHNRRNALVRRARSSDLLRRLSLQPLDRDRRGRMASSRPGSRIWNRASCTRPAARGGADVRPASTMIKPSFTPSTRWPAMGTICAPPLSMRKTNLARLLARRPDGIFVASFEQAEIGPDLFRAACDMGGLCGTALEAVSQI
jgi:hypothetical protein